MKIFCKNCTFKFGKHECASWEWRYRNELGDRADNSKGECKNYIRKFWKFWVKEK
jgi:hypothetical protein